MHGKIVEGNPPAGHQALLAWGVSSLTRRPVNSGLAGPVPGTMQASSGMVALLASVVRRCKHTR